MRLAYPEVVFDGLPNYEEALYFVAKTTGLCYNKPIEPDYEPSALEEFIGKRIKMGHESILEHVNFSVMIMCDRGISHELVRHRLAAFTQQSTRYIDPTLIGNGGHVTYIIPPWCNNITPGEYNYTTSVPVGLADAELTWYDTMLYIENNYKAMRKAGWAAEQARSILPNSLATKIRITANIREWRHIFSLRAFGRTGKPHPQMVQIMWPIAKYFHEKYPVFFEDPDGYAQEAWKVGSFRVIKS